MPVRKCSVKKKSGYKYGSKGKCYTGKSAKNKAKCQGRAIKISQSRVMIFIILFVVSIFMINSVHASTGIPDLISRWDLDDANVDGLVNETSGVKDTYLLNNGTLYGKTFNHGTNNGATLYNNLTGTITGASWDHDAELGRDVLNFDGVGDKVEVLNFPELKQGLTFSSKFYFDDNNFGSFSNIVGSHVSDAFFIRTASGEKRLYSRTKTSSGTVTQNIYPTLGQWNTVTVTYDGSNMISYLNGVLVDNDTQTGDLDTQDGEFNIGYFGSASINGSISDVIILDKALNSDEVLNLYNTGNINTTGYYHEINFPLDEGTGSNVYTKEGKFGGNYEFDGVTSYINLGNLSYFYNGNFTICFWDKPFEVISSDSYYYTANNGGVNRFYLLRDNNNIRLGIYSWNPTIYNVIDENWNYICSSLEGNNGSLYLNGDKMSQQSGITLGSNTNDFWIGEDTESFNGSIDEVKIWNRALTQTEIQEEMNANAVANPDGIVAYYDFNERTNNGTETVYDNNHLTNGARQNTAELEAPFFSWDKAINFDGVDDYIEIQNNESLNFGSNGFTISQFFKLNELGGYSIVEKRLGIAEGYRTVISANKCGLGLDTGGTETILTTTTTILPNVWYNCVATYNGSIAKIYLNGIEENSVSKTGSTDNSDVLDIGRGLGYFNGSIADVRIYDRALSEQEVKSLYDESPILDNMDLLPDYPFSNDTLYVTANATDYQNDTISFDYTWYLNDVELLSEVLSTLSPGNFSKNDNLIVSVKAYDGYSYSYPYNDSVTIINLAPELNYVYNDNLQGKVNFSDYDDDLLGYDWKWYINGTVNKSGSTSRIYDANTGYLIDTLDYDFTDLDITLYEGIVFSARAYDGENYTDWYNSTLNLINNTGFDSYSPVNDTFQTGEGTVVEFEVESLWANTIKWYLDGVLQAIGDSWTWFVGVQDADIDPEKNIEVYGYNDTNYAYKEWNATVTQTFPLEIESISPTNGIFDSNIPISCFVNDSEYWFKDSLFDFQVYYDGTWHNSTLNSSSAYHKAYTLHVSEQSGVMVRCRSFDGVYYSNWTDTSMNLTIAHKKNKLELFDLSGVRRKTPYTQTAYNSHCKIDSNINSEYISNIYIDCENDGLWDGMVKHNSSEQVKEDSLFSVCTFPETGSYKVSTGCVVQKTNTSKNWETQFCVGLDDTEEYCNYNKNYLVKVVGTDE